MILFFFPGTGRRTPSSRTGSRCPWTHRTRGRSWSTTWWPTPSTSSKSSEPTSTATACTARSSRPRPKVRLKTPKHFHSLFKQCSLICLGIFLRCIHCHWVDVTLDSSEISPTSEGKLRILDGKIQENIHHILSLLSPSASLTFLHFLSTMSSRWRAWMVRVPSDCLSLRTALFHW